MPKSLSPGSQNQGAALGSKSGFSNTITSRLSYLLVAISVVACGPVTGSKVKSDNLPSLKPGRNESPLSYNFQALNERGETCSTGPHHFDSVKSMCLHIQNEDENNNCAKEERARKFDEICEPAGFSQLESLKCEFFLLNKKAVVGSDGEHQVDQLVASTKYCVGYQADESPDKLTVTSEQTLMTERGKDYVLKVDMIFSREKDKSGAPTDANIEFFTQDSDMKTKVLMDPYNFRSDGQIKTKPTRDFRYRYLVKCVKTWAC